MTTSAGMSESARPPAFAWDDWYATIGGRSIKVDQVDSYLRQIFDNQYPRCDGPVAPEQHLFTSPTHAADHLKQKAIEFGGDIVGICAIEPTDVYRGRTVTHTYAIASSAFILGEIGAVSGSRHTVATRSSLSR